MLTDHFKSFDHTYRDLYQKASLQLLFLILGPLENGKIYRQGGKAREEEVGVGMVGRKERDLQNCFRAL